MSDEQDSWVQNTFGVSVPGVLDQAKQTVLGTDEMAPPSPGVELEHPMPYNAPTYPSPGMEPEYPMPPDGYAPQYGPPEPPHCDPPAYPPGPPSYPPKPPGRKPYPPEQGPYPPSPPAYPPSPGPYPPNQGPYPPTPGPYPPGPGPQPPAPAPYPKERRTLYEPMTGEDVKEAQTLLNKHGASLNPDGKFGSKTTTAVKAFQASHPPLKTDGKIGKQTWWALDAAYPPAPPEPYPPVPPSPIPPVPPNPVPPAPIPPSPVPPVPPPNPVPPPSPPDTKPRAVIFTVTSEANNNAVPAATVSVKGQSEKTGNTGQATFSLAPGKYPFAVAAEGFELFAGDFEVTTNEETEHHVELKGGGPVPPPPPTGNKLRFTVLDFKANTGIKGATILIESSTAEFAKNSATTDGNGKASFDLPPGSGNLTLNIRVTAEKFEDFRGVFKLPADGFDQEVHLKSKDRVHEVNFWVFDHQLEELEGAKIEIAGKSHTTDKRGQVDVEVQPGPQPYIVTKEGFKPFNGKVDMPADKDVLEKVRMVALAVCKVKIKVTDKDDAKIVIKQAEILLDGVTPHVTGGKTDDNGELVCMVPPGNHDFVATAKDQGYGEARGTFETKVGQDTDLPIRMTKGGALKRGAIHIRVIDKVSRKPIDGAKFAIAEISATSNKDGRLGITGIDPGPRKYTLTKEGYTTRTDDIVAKEVRDFEPVPPDDDIELTPDPTQTGGVFVVVTDKFTKKPINGAKLTIGKLSDTSVDGRIDIVGGLPVGKQKYTLTKSGYATKTGEIEVKVAPDPDSPEPPPQPESIQMTPAPPAAKTGTLAVHTFFKDANGNQLDVADVTVELQSIPDFKKIPTQTTDQKGIAEFKKVPVGRYTVHAIEKGANGSAIEQFEVKENTTTPAPMSLFRLAPPVPPPNPVPPQPSTKSQKWSIRSEESLGGGEVAVAATLGFTLTDREKNKKFRLQFVGAGGSWSPAPAASSQGISGATEFETLEPVNVSDFNGNGEIHLQGATIPILGPFGIGWSNGLAVLARSARAKNVDISGFSVGTANAEVTALIGRWIVIG